MIQWERNEWIINRFISCSLHIHYLCCVFCTRLFFPITWISSILQTLSSLYPFLCARLIWISIFLHSFLLIFKCISAAVLSEWESHQIEWTELEIESQDDVDVDEMNAALNRPLPNNAHKQWNEMWYLYSIIYSEWYLYHFYWEFRISLAFDDCFITNSCTVQKPTHWEWNQNEYENNGIRLFAECNLIIVNLFSKSIRTKESRSVDECRSRRYCLSTFNIALNGYQLYFSFLHSKPQFISIKRTEYPIGKRMTENCLKSLSNAQPHCD